jgi:hypothetical protein
MPPVDPGWPWLDVFEPSGEQIALLMDKAMPWYDATYGPRVSAGRDPSFDFDYWELEPITRTRLVGFADALYLWIDSLTRRPRGVNAGEMDAMRRALNLAIYRGETQMAGLEIVDWRTLPDGPERWDPKLFTPGFVQAAIMKLVRVERVDELHGDLARMPASMLVQVVWNALPTAKELWARYKETGVLPA